MFTLACCIANTVNLYIKFGFKKLFEVLFCKNLAKQHQKWTIFCKNLLHMDNDLK